MRNIGIILLVVGFVWMAFFWFAIGPVARAKIQYVTQEFPAQQTYSTNDLIRAYGVGVRTVGSVELWSFFGGFMMFAGGIILVIPCRRDSTATKPPVL
jgi:hypothetical protein